MTDPTPTDPIERAKAVAADVLDEWRACEQHRTLEDLGESIVAGLSAAGLLAATPASPGEVREALALLVKAVIPEVDEKGAGGYLLARLADARDVLAKTPASSPAPADDEAAQGALVNDGAAWSAMSQEDCPTCPDPARSRMTGRITFARVDRSCPHHAEHLAVRQGEVIGHQAERVQELIREREAAKSATEAAYDLAEQYAREAGHDIGRDDVLRYVEEYWRQRAGWQGQMTDLERFHWGVYQIPTELAQAITSRRIASVTATELAERIIERINAINRRTGRQKAAELFPRPKAPTGEAPALFEDAS